jgi:WD40 repeat protein
MWNNSDSMIATCGSDRMVCVWDLRKAAKPIVINNESESCIMACDWTEDNKHVLSSTMNGHINSLNVETNKMVLKHDTMACTPEIESNIIYSLKAVKNHPNKRATNLFTIGAENKLIYLTDYNPSAKYESWLLEISSKYEGHSAGIRDA